MMSKIYILRVTSEFSAAMALRDYVGQCANLHGHTFKVEAAVQAKQLNAIGMSVDFSDLKKALDDLTATFDHRYLNEIPPFDIQNPTTENLASYLFDGLTAVLQTQHPEVELKSVTVWESSEASVTVSCE